MNGWSGEYWGHLVWWNERKGGGEEGGYVWRNNMVREEITGMVERVERWM